MNKYLLLGVLSFALKAQPISFVVVEVPVYEIKTELFYTKLEMAYAKHTIQNPQDWLQDTRPRIVKRVDLVFTKYPQDTSKWITPYDNLLNRRVREIRRLIPQISDSVKWRIVLQTDCKTEEQAQKLFHGAVIMYDIELTPAIQSNIEYIRNIILGKSPFADSTAFKVLQRNQDWKEMLVVNDWTGSMYIYGAQVVLWHRLHFKQKRIKHLVFFNDGNTKPDSEKQIGNTGGIFYAPADQTNLIIKTMREVMLSGHGGDVPENDLEAVLYAIRRFKGDFQTLVLIADNNSSVRDIELLPLIDVPLRIVLCGVKNSDIHPDYLQIARATGGSIHTIDRDIIHLASLQEGDTIGVGKTVYKVMNNKLVAVE
ncbi:MAG: hypothetical protein NZM38_11310 [Cytophagales bacterium]|nr:hypothetical protein [Cytophagales bacterium]MDW8385344.1 hypothetical protein [Flammeovirgaceae bacterium]